MKTIFQTVQILVASITLIALVEVWSLATLRNTCLQAQNNSDYTWRVEACANLLQPFIN